MELGNEMMGHSRGKFPIEDRKTYGELFLPLLTALENGSYGIEIKTDVFEMHPYCWCDKSDCPQCGSATQPQFKHYESGLEIQWYKYAMRDAYSNIEINPEMIQNIIMTCIASLPQEMRQRYIRNDDVNKMYPNVIDPTRLMAKLARNSVSGSPRSSVSTPLFDKTAHATLTAACRAASAPGVLLPKNNKDK
jgi:hypothetical protein